VSETYHKENEAGSRSIVRRHNVSDHGQVMKRRQEVKFPMLCCTETLSLTQWRPLRQYPDCSNYNGYLAYDP
jgi:hypothetical protein